MTQKYSDEVLEETPARAAKLLNGIGAEPVIRTLMHDPGKMTDDDIAEGGKLLLACWGQLPGAKVERDTEEARKQRAATAELDQWDEPNFGRYGAALRRRFPRAGEYVFHDLSASTGAAAVAGVATFLKRVEALEKGTDPGRQDTKKEDKKAVELLSTRGLDKAERARLAALVEVALAPTATLDPAPEHDAQRTEQRKSALTDLKDWYEEWASTARSVVKKRGYLIRMGLANRKMGKKDKEEGGDKPK
jgi:hypothetical protein